MPERVPAFRSRSDQAPPLGRVEVRQWIEEDLLGDENVVRPDPLPQIGVPHSPLPVHPRPGGWISTPSTVLTALHRVGLPMLGASASQAPRCLLLDRK